METVNSPIVMDVKELDGDRLSIADPVEHRIEDLKLDGHDDPKDPADTAPNAGHGLVSILRRVDERTLELTDAYNGKTAITEELVLAADSKMLTMTVHIVHHEKPYVLVFERA